MATATKPKPKPTPAAEANPPDEVTEDTRYDLTDAGRLVLATGRVVTVPAEGVYAATHHYDDEIGATVPVVSAFVLAED